MSEPFLGEIRIVGFNFPPRGWADCDGQILPIAQNSALFSLLGTMYGGDGRTTFALPNLRSRLPMHAGQGPGLSNRTQGEVGGYEWHALSVANLPSHSHPGTVAASTGEGNRSDPAGAYPARAEEPLQPYAGSAGAALAAGSVQTDAVGSGAPVDHLPPFLVLRFVIAITGLFPSRT